MKIKVNYPCEVEVDDDIFEKAIEKSIINNPDVAIVTRCKNCKYFNKVGCAIRIVDDSDKPNENDFCSFAERK